MDRLYELAFAIFSVLFGVALAIGMLMVFHSGFEFISQYLYAPRQL